MEMQSARGAVTSLVRLRRFALTAIGARGVRGRDSRDTSEGISVESWETFLTLERCASPLLAALTRTNRIQELPPKVRKLLTWRAKQETDMVLRAEREARALGAVAASVGETLVLLKGGVPAIASAAPPLHLFDVDILVNGPVVPVIERALTASGFEKAENNEPHHTHWMAPAERLPVEVHSTTDPNGTPVAPSVWSRVQSLPEGPGLCRLGWADQIVHLLQHSLDQHNDRHVRIRDILLIGWFGSHTDERERAVLENQLAELPNARGHRYRKLLDFARRILDGGHVMDPFEDEAILHFTAAVLAQTSGNRRAAPNITWSRAATVAAGNASPFGMVSFAAKNPFTGRIRFSGLQKKWPVAGRAITRFSRSGYYFLSVILGVPVLLSIRRKVRRDMLGDSVRDVNLL